MGGEDGEVERMETLVPFTVSVGLSSLQHREDATCLCDTSEKERTTDKNVSDGEITLYLWRFTFISLGDLAAKGGIVGWEERSGGGLVFK